MESKQQPIDEHDQHPTTHGKNAPALEKYFRAMIKSDASDLHIKVGGPAFFRVNTKIRSSKTDPLTADEIEDMVFEIMTEKQKNYFLENGNIDIAHQPADSDRFRLNVYRQRGDISIAARRVVRNIPDFKTLHLPRVMEEIAQHHHGLVLLSGPTGCGKSTTIASILEYINKKRACHILTIEDPIEFLYEDKKAIVSQREIGLDVPTFEQALKYMMREDPDIVLIGEMRDHETFQAALQAAETGHLVFGTVHASTAAQTIGRIVDLFPHESHELIRQTLAFNLHAVVCQKLLPSISEKLDRIPAVEVLLSNPSVGQLITESRDAELIDIIHSHEREGMQSFTKSLLGLVESDMIDPKVAFEVASNPEELKMAMKGISASKSSLLGR